LTPARLSAAVPLLARAAAYVGGTIVIAGLALLLNEWRHPTPWTGVVLAVFAYLIGGIAIVYAVIVYGVRARLLTWERATCFTIAGLGAAPLAVGAAAAFFRALGVLGATAFLCTAATLAVMATSGADYVKWNGGVLNDGERRRRLRIGWTLLVVGAALGVAALLG